METIKTEIRKSATWSIVLSLLMIASGVLAIAIPPVAGAAVTAIVGWLFVFSGALHVGLAWRGEGVASVLAELVIAALYGLVGVYMLASPVAGLVSLTLVIAAALLAIGVVEAVVAIQVRQLPGSGWLMFDGILTVALGALIASAWPVSAAWAVGTLIGVGMISSGFTRLMVSTSVRSLVTA